MRRPLATLAFVLGVPLVGMGACVPAACATSNSPETAESAGDEAPSGFTRVEVVGLLPTPQGDAVFLSEPGEERMLPIWIGPSEALAIQLRLDRRRFERPLTHDLLDSILEKLGGEVVRVHVDDLRSNTFVGTLFLEADDEVHELDTRPSDAIALALGSGAPIYVSDGVLDQASLTREDLRGMPDRPQPPPTDREPGPPTGDWL